MEKDNEISLLDPVASNIASLVHQEHHRDYELWYDQSQRKEYCEYKLYGWPNEKQMEIYQFRKDQKQHLIYVHYLAPIQNSGFKQFRVFIEKIHLALSTLAKLSFVQGLYVLKSSLAGFRVLFQKFGYVHIDDKLIGLNGQGAVKVWMNQNFAFNGAATSHVAPKWMSEEMKQKQMVATIFAIVCDRLEKNDRLRSFKKQKQLKLLSLTFQKTLHFIEEYVKIHEIIIPTSIPELLRLIRNQIHHTDFGRGSNNQKQLLSFKNPSPCTKRKNQKAGKQFEPKYYRNGLSGSPRGKRLYTLNDRFLSPNQDGIRARNRSEAGLSVASSRPRTTLTTRPIKPTKYFFSSKTVKPELVTQQERQNNFLQSSQISKDFCYAQSSKNQVQVFNFTQNQKATSKSQKKRKYSAVDKMALNGLNITPKTKQDKNIALSLARSMVVKKQLEESRKLQNMIPQEDHIPISETPSPNKNHNRPSSPKRTNPEEIYESDYKTVKPFLNYKSVKKSVINQHKQPRRQIIPHNLKNSFLKNIDMKSSEIIMERSSQYASIHDIMKTIKQSQIQTPLSDKCYDTFGNGQRNASLFVPNVVEKKKSSDINISNSTTDRKSGLQQDRERGGLINFASPTKPKQLKEGMFKSIFVEQSKEKIESLQ